MLAAILFWFDTLKRIAVACPAPTCKNLVRLEYLWGLLSLPLAVPLAPWRTRVFVAKNPARKKKQLYLLAELPDAFEP